MWFFTKVLEIILWELWEKFGEELSKVGWKAFTDWFSISRFFGLCFLIIGFSGLFYVPIPYFFNGGQIEVLYRNVSPELIGIGITVLLIDSANEQNARKREKEKLVLQMGSHNNAVSIEAVRILRSQGWGLSHGRRYLQDKTLAGRNYVNANLVGADLSDAYLCKADFSNANLSRAKLVRANFKGAILTRADFTGADLEGANLEGANLEGADINNALGLPYELYDQRQQMDNNSRSL